VPAPEPPLDPTATGPPDGGPGPLSAALDELGRPGPGGRPARVEDLLARHPALADDPEAVLELVHHEAQLRRRQGEQPDPEEYARRFPALAGPLRALLGVEGALRDAGRPGESTLAASTQTPRSPGGGAGEPGPPGPPPAPGPERLGPYRLLGVLGEGGMGTVYLAEDTRLHRRVALKTVRPDIAAHPGARDRFLREARAAALLGEHDHVVPVYHADEDRGVPFLAMPVLQGETLEDRLRREGKLPAAEAVRVAREAAEGLACAHAAGLVHRDVKPSNLWLGPPTARRVRVLDFGLARLAEGGGGLTQSGAVVGTPGYLAPEQADLGEVDARADVFGLGAVLYRMLTGRPPFPGPSMLKYLGSVSQGPPPAARKVEPGVPAALSDLVQSMLAKDPARRPASAREAAEALGRIAEGREDAAPPPAPAPRSTRVAPPPRRPDPAGGPAGAAAGQGPVGLTSAGQGGPGGRGPAGGRLRGRPALAQARGARPAGAGRGRLRDQSGRAPQRRGPAVAGGVRRLGRRVQPALPRRRPKAHRRPA
jgi:hypothetical protein